MFSGFSSPPLTRARRCFWLSPSAPPAPPIEVRPIVWGPSPPKGWPPPPEVALRPPEPPARFELASGPSLWGPVVGKLVGPLGGLGQSGRGRAFLLFVLGFIFGLWPPVCVHEGQGKSSSPAALFPGPCTSHVFRASFLMFEHWTKAAPISLCPGRDLLYCTP